MDRRTFVGSVAGGLFVAPLIAKAQQTPKVPLVGILVTSGKNPSVGNFRDGLRRLGYLEGKNIHLAYRSADGKQAALPDLAADLVRRDADVIYALGPAAVKAAMEATRVIPIVALDLETDPVQSGLARSLSRPGGNITGLFLDLASLTGKWLELLREADPRIQHVSALWDSTTGSGQLAAAKAAAQVFALDLQTLEVRTSADFDDALSAGVRSGARALIVLSSPLTSANSKQIADFTVTNRLPAISPFWEFAQAGGLMSYGPNVGEFDPQAAIYVDKILKGAKPGDLPIERPTKFLMVINLKTAKAFGLTIPQSLLQRADEVIQ